MISSVSVDIHVDRTPGHDFAKWGVHPSPRDHRQMELPVKTSFHDLQILTVCGEPVFQDFWDFNSAGLAWGAGTYILQVFPPDGVSGLLHVHSDQPCAGLRLLHFHSDRTYMGSRRVHLHSYQPCAGLRLSDLQHGRTCPGSELSDFHSDQPCRVPGLAGFHHGRFCRSGRTTGKCCRLNLVRQAEGWQCSPSRAPNAGRSPSPRDQRHLQETEMRNLLALRTFPDCTGSPCACI